MCVFEVRQVTELQGSSINKNQSKNSNATSNRQDVPDLMDFIMSVSLNKPGAKKRRPKKAKPLPVKKHRPPLAEEAKHGPADEVSPLEESEKEDVEVHFQLRSNFGGSQGQGQWQEAALERHKPT